MKSILTKRQTKQFSKTNVMVDGEKVDINATVRYDDQCGNGHNSFSITGEYWYSGNPHNDRNMISCGYIHEAIEQAFPELKPFIKWHLCDSYTPMYYIENTLYHARDTDYNGLKKGEYSAYTVNVIADINKDETDVVVYSSGVMYTNKQKNANLEKSNLKELYKINEAISKIKPQLNPRTISVNSEYSESEGKEINLKGARSCAIWPDATLNQLQSKEELLFRLPALMANFKLDVESLGFTY